MSKLWIRLKPGLSPVVVNTTSRSVVLAPGQAVEVEYAIYKAYFEPYADIVIDLPKPAKKREKKTLLPLDEE